MAYISSEALDYAMELYTNKKIDKISIGILEAIDKYFGVHSTQKKINNEFGRVSLVIRHIVIRNV